MTVPAKRDIMIAKDRFEHLLLHWLVCYYFPMAKSARWTGVGGASLEIEDEQQDYCISFITALELFQLRIPEKIFFEWYHDYQSTPLFEFYHSHKDYPIDDETGKMIDKAWYKRLCAEDNPTMTPEEVDARVAMFFPE